ncbi:hypothetical protein ACFP4H_12805 [Pseudophaeobacter arcticus]|jgi:hypothetical protein|uniref:hypothetical protein n=2 Tax=Pseudophaeobacter arcticus TaxID=385492 RepID=UPI00042A884A
MMQVPVKKGPEREMLEFIRSQLRFVEMDVSAHCSARPEAMSRFMERLRDSGAVVPCGVSGGLRYLTAWGPQEAVKIDAMDKAGELTAKRARSYLLELIEGAAAEGVSVDIPTSKPGTDHERKIWQFISAHRHFTNGDVMAAFPENPLETMGFLRALRAAKVVKFWGREKATAFYTVHSPKEQRVAAKDLRSSTEGAIWSAIRIKRRFRPLELHQALLPTRPELSQDEVTRYCRTLNKAGYIKPPKPTKKITCETPFNLVNNTGPLPPHSQRVTVIVDPNEDRISYSPLGQVQ